MKPKPKRKSQPTLISLRQIPPLPLSLPLKFLFPNHLPRLSCQILLPCPSASTLNYDCSSTSSSALCPWRYSRAVSRPIRTGTCVAEVPAPGGLGGQHQFGKVVKVEQRFSFLIAVEGRITSERWLALLYTTYHLWDYVWTLFLIPRISYCKRINYGDNISITSSCVKVTMRAGYRRELYNIYNPQKRFRI
jgi:hypothetical protein